MSTATRINAANVAHVLEGLLSKSVKVCDAAPFAPSAATWRGLVTNDNVLVGVIGGDLAFAHKAGAALAMIPAGAVEDHGDAPNEEWLEFYAEVANVLSRVVNEAAPSRVRIDPGLTHDPDALQAVLAAGPGLTLAVEIQGYGSGTVGIWTNF
jgi:hypothetical protein